MLCLLSGAGTESAQAGRQADRLAPLPCRGGRPDGFNGLRESRIAVVRGWWIGYLGNSSGGKGNSPNSFGVEGNRRK